MSVGADDVAQAGIRILSNPRNGTCHDNRVALGNGLNTVPHLLAALLRMVYGPCKPLVDDTMVMCPERCWRIVGRTALVMATCREKLVSNCERISPTVRSSANPATANPALLTRRSMRP